jgi:hypothetical protein
MSRWVLFIFCFNANGSKIEGTPDCGSSRLIIFLFEYGSAAGALIFIRIKEMRMLDPVQSGNPSHGFIPPRLLKSSA